MPKSCSFCSFCSFFTSRNERPQNDEKEQKEQLFAYTCVRDGCHNLANCGSLCSVHRKKKPGRRKAADWDLGCYLCAEPGELLCCEAPGCTRTAHVACAGLSAVPAAEWRCADCRAPDVTTAAAWLLRLAEPRAQGSPH